MPLLGGFDETDGARRALVAVDLLLERDGAHGLEDARMVALDERPAVIAQDVAEMEVDGFAVLVEGEAPADNDIEPAHRSLHPALVGAGVVRQDSFQRRMDPLLRQIIGLDDRARLDAVLDDGRPDVLEVLEVVGAGVCVLDEQGHHDMVVAVDHVRREPKRVSLFGRRFDRLCAVCLLGAQPELVVTRDHGDLELEGLVPEDEDEVDVVDVLHPRVRRIVTMLTVLPGHRNVQVRELGLLHHVGDAVALRVEQFDAVFELAGETDLHFLQVPAPGRDTDPVVRTFLRRVGAQVEVLDADVDRTQKFMAPRHELAGRGAPPAMLSAILAGACTQSEVAVHDRLPFIWRLSLQSCCLDWLKLDFDCRRSID